MPLYHRHIIIFPQLSHGILIRVKGYPSVLHREDLVAELLAAGDKIISHRVPSEKRFASGPFVILGRGLGHALHSG